MPNDEIHRLSAEAEKLRPAAERESPAVVRWAETLAKRNYVLILSFSRRVWLLLAVLTVAILGLGVAAVLTTITASHNATHGVELAKQNRGLIRASQAAYCKLKLYDLVTGGQTLTPAQIKTFEHLGFSVRPQIEAMKHALRLVQSIPSGKQCIPQIRAELRHDGLPLSHAAEAILLGGLAATTTSPGPKRSSRAAPRGPTASIAPPRARHQRPSTPNRTTTSPSNTPTSPTATPSTASSSPYAAPPPPANPAQSPPAPPMPTVTTPAPLSVPPLTVPTLPKPPCVRVPPLSVC